MVKCAQGGGPLEKYHKSPKPFNETSLGYLICKKPSTTNKAGEDICLKVPLRSLKITEAVETFICKDI